MHTHFVVLFLTAVLIFTFIDGRPEHRIEKRSTRCDPYAYCRGENFPHEVMLDARKIKCDNVPQSRDHCCLPQARHYVCYNIKVDGHDLNYNETSNAVSTDFTGLCNAMARSRGKKTGKHSSAVVDNGGGALAWRYGEWAIVPPSTRHVEHLACEFF